MIWQSYWENKKGAVFCPTVYIVLCPCSLTAWTNIWYISVHDCKNNFTVEDYLNETVLGSIFNIIVKDVSRLPIIR